MLSDTKARKLKASDKPISDTMIRGLYLFPTAENGKGKWILRFLSPETRKRRDMGLGTYPLVTIRDARRKAFELRQQIEDGIDPIEERRRQEEADRNHRTVPTFEQAARTLHADLAPGFRNRKHRDQWLNTLEDHVFAKIGKKPVNELTPQDFAGCLKSIWLKKPETASRIRQRCDAVMNWGAAQGYIMASPVGVVDKLLPRQPGKRERVAHHPAMPWRDVPALYIEGRNIGYDVPALFVLKVVATSSRRCVEWLVLAGLNFSFVKKQNPSRISRLRRTVERASRSRIRETSASCPILAILSA